MLSRLTIEGKDWFLLLWVGFCIEAVLWEICGLW